MVKSLKEDLRELFIKFNDPTIRQLGEYEDVVKPLDRVYYESGIEMYYENRTLQFLWTQWQLSSIRTMNIVNQNISIITKFKSALQKFGFGK